MRAITFYLGFGLQLLGLATVGICFIAGISAGDYGRIELAQFVGGATAFYFGSWVRSR